MNSASNYKGLMTMVIILIITVITLSGCAKSNADSGKDNDTHVPPIVALCESIDYADTVSLHSEEAMKGHMKNIIKLMMKSDSISMAKGLDIFFDGLDGDAQSLRLAFRHAERYLNNPNSPVRDETLYLQFLSSLLRRSDLPDDISARAEEKKRKTMLNRPGMRANDFRYIDREGKEGTLYAIRSDRTMLIFYDPECPHCPEILERIATNKKVNSAIEIGDLKVLAVYTEGKRDVWENSKSHMPDNWTIGYDLTGVLDEDLYDIPAMPTVYMLNADKRVLIKDMAW